MKNYSETKDFNKLGALMKHRIQMLRMCVPNWDEQKDAREISACRMAEAVSEMLHQCRLMGKTLTTPDILSTQELIFEKRYKDLYGTPIAFVSAMTLAILGDANGNGTWYGQNLVNSLVMAQPICGDVKNEPISQQQIQAYANTLGI